MTQIFVFFLTILVWSTNIFAGGEISVGLVKSRSDSNMEVTISDSYLGFGKTLYVTDSYPGFGKTFYLTEDANSANIKLKKPPNPEEPNSADFRLFFFDSYPGYGEVIYVADSYPGFGKMVYFADSNPGFGKSVYVEDPLLRFNKKLIAVILFKLGAL